MTPKVVQNFLLDADQKGLHGNKPRLDYFFLRLVD